MKKEQEHTIDDILGDDAFWKVNKRITRSVGLYASAILADLISKRSYFKSKNQLDKNGGFFNTGENLENDFGIKRSPRDGAILRLKKAGFIETRLFGMPRRTHFYINDLNIIKFLSHLVDNRHYSLSETSKLSVENQQSSLSESNTYNKNKEQELINKNKEQSYSDSFNSDIQFIRDNTSLQFRNKSELQKQKIYKFNLLYKKAVLATDQNTVTLAIRGYAKADCFFNGDAKGKWNFEKLLRNDSSLDKWAVSGRDILPSKGGLDHTRSDINFNLGWFNNEEKRLFKESNLSQSEFEKKILKERTKRGEIWKNSQV